MARYRSFTEIYNPEYPRELGATVAKFRKLCNGSIYSLTREQRVEYAQAIERGIKAKQKAEFFAAFTPKTPAVNCASGTPYPDGESIHKALVERYRARIHSDPERIRKRRTLWDLREQYMQAMIEKHGKAWWKANGDRVL